MASLIRTAILKSSLRGSLPCEANPLAVLVNFSVFFPQAFATAVTTWLVGAIGFKFAS